MTSKEWEEINRIIKEDVKQEKKSVVRKMIDRNMSFQDCKTVLMAFSGNTPINTPATVETVQNKPVNGSETVSDNLQNQLERVSDAGQLNIDEIQQNIQALIDNYLEINDIQDMHKQPQRVFNAMIMYIGNHYFKGTTILKSEYRKNNSYDINKLVQVLDYYVYLCSYYNKAFTLDGGAYFCGLHNNYLTEHKEKLTLAGFNPLKKSEETISASILDNKQCVGSIAYLNHVFNWQTNTTHTEKKETIVIYPSLSSNQAQSTPQITTTETKQVL